MSTPYVGEIRMVGFNFAPQGWALCNGQTLPISQNDVLFNLIGTTYGGDGVSTFSLPNLQGRIPFHQGTNSQGDVLVIGKFSGEENVLLTTSQLPVHNHALSANSANGTQPGPASGLWAASTLEEFSTETSSHSMAPSTTLAVGGGQPHDNMPPFLVVNFVISLYGVFPSQN